MSNQILVLGMNPAGKVPAALFNVNVGVGRVDPGSIPRKCLLVGNMMTGTATPDSSIVAVTAGLDVDAAFGSRSELARMIKKAQLTPGVRLYAAPCTESAGAKSTCTVTFATNASSDGTHVFVIDGDVVYFSVASGDTPTVQAAALVTAITQGTHLPVTGGNAAGVVTITAAQRGKRGDEITVYRDPASQTPPSGTTVVLASTNSYVVNPGPSGVVGVRLGSGGAVDSVDAVIALLAGDTFFTIGVAHTDSTNLAKWKAYNLAKSAIGTQRFEHIVVGSNDLEAAAKALGQAVNVQRFVFPWMQGAEATGAEIAASAAAVITQYDQGNPNRRFNGVTLPGIPPQRSKLDGATEGENGTQQSALDEGLTPIVSTSDGLAIIVRCITGLSLRNSVPFHGCLDHGQARTPDVSAELLMLAWSTEFAVNNEWVGPDPAPGEPSPPEGKAFPRLWGSYAAKLLKAKISEHWFESVTVVAEYDSTGKQLLTSINEEIAAQNHRVGGNINQLI